MRFVLGLVLYSASIGGGFYLTGEILWQIRRRVFGWRVSRDESFAFMDFVVGATERFVVTTFVILAPKYVAPFIGAWMTLKFAAGWQRASYNEHTIDHSLLGLVGSVISFAIAVICGALLNPDALCYFAKWGEDGR